MKNPSTPNPSEVPLGDQQHRDRQYRDRQHRNQQHRNQQDLTLSDADLFGTVPRTPPLLGHPVAPTSETTIGPPPRSMVIMVGAIVALAASAMAGWWVHSRWSYIAVAVAVAAVSIVAVVITQPEPDVSIASRLDLAKPTDHPQP